MSSSLIIESVLTLILLKTTLTEIIGAESIQVLSDLLEDLDKNWSLKGNPKLGCCYLNDSSFELICYSSGNIASLWVKDVIWTTIHFCFFLTYYGQNENL